MCIGCSQLSVTGNEPNDPYMNLRARYRACEFAIFADNSTYNQRAFSPRNNTAPGETYFWIRASMDTTPHWTFFIESFQPASMIIGGDTIYPKYIWDGVQIQPGLQYHLFGRWYVEGGPMYYGFSASRRGDEIGGCVFLRGEF